MQYLRSYEYVFDNPKWFKNILLCTVCAFIPIIGMIVLMGYMCEVFDALRRREEETYPDFDFGRFTEYLTRGVWPFLAVFVASLVMVPVFWLFMAVAIFSGAAASEVHQALVALVVVFGILIYFGLIIAINVVMEAILIRAIILRAFAKVFSFEFFVDFAKRMFWQIVLMQLFLMVSGILWMLAGLVLCFVGIYLVMPLVMYAQFHLRAQLYEEYLRRGGMEVCE